jgi:hypothetical protein
MKKISRRDFLKSTALGLGTVLLTACGANPASPPALPAVRLTPGEAALQPPAAGTPAQLPATPTVKPRQPNAATATAKPKGKAPTSVPSLVKMDAATSLILGRPTDTSITASFIAAASTEIYYAYGVAPGAYTARTPAQTAAVGIPLVTLIDKLQPDTRYFYRAVTGDVPGAEHSFHTQRAPGSSFCFTVDADPHNRDPNFNGELYIKTLNNARSDQPDFHINLGDTFMTEKIAPQTLAEAESTFTDLRPTFGIIAADAPLFLVNGNHEGELGWLLHGKDKNLPLWSTQLRQKYYPNPKPGGFYTGSSIADPTLGSPRDSYYAWTWGDAQLIVLDPFWYTTQKPQTNDLNTNWNWTLGREQYNWLKTALETSRSKFKFVFAHHLVGGGQDARGGIEFARFFEWGGGNANGSAGFDAHRPGWGKPIHQLLVEHNVSMVLHGHDHIFVKQDLDGIVYLEVPQPSIVVGNGARLAADYGYLAGDVLSSSGYVRVSLSPEHAVVEYLRACLPQDEKSGLQNGQVDDRFEIG